MNAAVAENVEAEGDTIIFIGDELRHAREAMSMSVEDVARRLNLDVQVVSCLEKNNYESLPEPAYIRGYLLAYIRLMDMPISLLDAFDVANVSSRPLLTIGSSMQASCSRDGWVRCVSNGLIILLVIALGAWVLEQSFDGFGTEDVAVFRSDEEALMEKEITVNVPVSSIQNKHDEVAAIEAHEVAGLDAVELGEAGIEVQTDAISVPAVDEAVSLEPLLTIRLLGDSWIRINDASGAKLQAGTYAKDEEIKLSHKGEIHLIIGRTHNVELDYDGNRVDLSGYKSGRVARLILGKPAE